ncbi:MAG TPA: hypothetical protein VEG33_15380 [Streptosporangiaceae bacterium]|nr:hypothetical protein [Streptosporangiaceae bacterium]
MKWSVGIETQGDRVLSREEIVELADAVAASSGIATGIGTNRYGAQLLVEAGTRDAAIEKARSEFARAVAQAGLPVYPIVRVEAVGEDEDGHDDGSGSVYGGGEGEDSSVPGEDPGVPGKDRGVPGEDPGVPGEDPGVPGEDSGG